MNNISLRPDEALDRQVSLFANAMDTENPAQISLIDVLERTCSTEPITYENQVSNRENYLQHKCEKNMKNKNAKKVQTNNRETGEITEIVLSFRFWKEVVGKNGETTLKIVHTELYDFFKKLGIIKLVVDNKGLIRILVRINKNVVREIDIAELQNIVNKSIDSLPDQISEHKTKEDLHEIMIKGINNYICDNKINYKIPFERLNFVKDTKEKAFFFFKNGFVEISKDGISLKPYNELHGYIWESQIIDHDFEVIPTDKITEIHDFCFVKFTKNICSTKSPDTLDTPRVTALCCCIGSLLHNYIDPANMLAIIFTESNVDDEAEGRSGKSLLIEQAIGKLRKVTSIDAKAMNHHSEFPFQSADYDTEIILIDDCTKNFNFEYYFSKITGSTEINKKHRQSFQIQCKYAFTSNYGVPGTSGSNLARRFDMELYQYYSNTFTPKDDFGKAFFHTWNSVDWNLFYNFMLRNVQIYLKHNCKIPSYSSETIDQKKSLSSTSQAFIEFAEDLERDTPLSITGIYLRFLNENCITSKDVSKIKFGKWLKIYCQTKNLIYTQPVCKLNETSKPERCHNLGNQKQ